MTIMKLEALKADVANTDVVSTHISTDGCSTKLSTITDPEDQLNLMMPITEDEEDQNSSFIGKIPANIYGYMKALVLTTNLSTEDKTKEVPGTHPYFLEHAPDTKSDRSDPFFPNYDCGDLDAPIMPGGMGLLLACLAKKCKLGENEVHPYFLETPPSSKTHYEDPLFPTTVVCDTPR